MVRMLEGLHGSAEAEYEAAIRALFPYDDKFRRLQMLTESNARAQIPLTIMGLFRRRFKSTVLAIVQEENNLNKVGLDRKGRLELSEIVTHPRKPEEEEKY